MRIENRERRYLCVPKEKHHPQREGEEENITEKKEYSFGFVRDGHCSTSVALYNTIDRCQVALYERLAIR
jgi:hypothetical protein